MGQPFRDDLGAASERACQLELENARLRRELDVARATLRVRDRLPRIVVVCAVVAGFAGGAIFYGILAFSHARARVGAVPALLPSADAAMPPPANALKPGACPCRVETMPCVCP